MVYDGMSEPPLSLPITKCRRPVLDLFGAVIALCLVHMVLQGLLQRLTHSVFIFKTNQSKKITVEFQHLSFKWLLFTQIQ